MFVLAKIQSNYYRTNFFMQKTMKNTGPPAKTCGYMTQ